MKKIYRDFAFARVPAGLASTALARLWFEAAGLFGAMAGVHASFKKISLKRFDFGANYSFEILTRDFRGKNPGTRRSETATPDRKDAILLRRA